MIDINDIAALLHVEEKLRAHGAAFPNMLAAVRAKLNQHEAEHAPQQEAQPEAEPLSPKVPEDSPTEANSDAKIDRRV